MAYTPSQDLLENYAHVLINFALGSGEGVKPGEVVWMRLHESAKPMYVPLRNAIIRAGGHPIVQYIADDVDQAGSYDLLSDAQLSFFPELYYKGLVDQIDHMVYIISEFDKYELQRVDPKKIMRAQNTLRPYMEMRNAKEAEGRFTWTLAMYGTPAMAADVGMSEEDYWGEIIKACYLDQPDPIASWKQTFGELARIQTALNALAIQYLRVEAEGTDLRVGIGPKRRWLGGGGRNIPSFELFISPDARLTEGVITFNQPLYRHGNKMDGIRLVFEKGRIIEATATEGQEFLREMIAAENADRIGEYSLTDGRFSRITKVMGETLFDENMGGEQGNTHLAVGNAYQDSYPGDASQVTQEEWEALGYNQSPVHTDIVSTTQRTVTATLEDGSELIIYKDGRFCL